MKSLRLVILLLLALFADGLVQTAEAHPRGRHRMHARHHRGPRYRRPLPPPPFVAPPPPPHVRHRRIARRVIRHHATCRPNCRSTHGARR